MNVLFVLWLILIFKICLFLSLIFFIEIFVWLDFWKRNVILLCVILFLVVLGFIM